MTTPQEDRKVYLSLGIHDSIDRSIPEAGRANARNLLERQLRQTQGQVVFCIEDISMPLSTVEAISQQSASGFSPIQAYVRGIMMAELGRVLNQGDPGYAEFLGARVYTHDGQVNDVMMAEEVWKQYPGRVRLMSEGIPDDQLRIRFTLNDERTASMEFSEAMRLAKEGNFDSAVAHLQRSASDTAEFAEIREALLAQRIDTVMQDANISAVVVRFGIQHQVIERSLARRGRTVESEFDRDDQGEVFANTPYGRMVELSRSTSGAHIAELEWYQAVVAGVLENTLATVMQESEGQIDYNFISSAVQQTVDQHASSMDQIREIELRIRQAVASGSTYIDVIENLGA